MKKLLASIMVMILTLTAFAGTTSMFTAVEAETEDTVSEIYGYFAIDADGFDCAWGKFSSDNPGEPELKAIMEETIAAEFAGGVVYGYLSGTSEFYSLDPITWEYNIIGPSIEPAMVLDMAFNHADQVMYAIVSLDETDYLDLCTINLTNGRITPVGTLDITAANIVISTNGEAYVLSYGEPAMLYSLDLNSATTTLIGSTGLNLRYIQSATWDHNTNTMYWAQYYDSENNGLCTVDTQTGAATMIGQIGGGAEVVALFTTNELYVEPPAPAEDVTISFRDGLDDTIFTQYTTAPGSVLSYDDFPTPPEHEGYNFIGWDYDGLAVWEDITITANYRDPNLVAWYFEEDPFASGEWTCIDADGDGINWRWLTAADGIDPYEGQGVVNSESYINGYGALTPDNWLISPAFIAGSELTFYMEGQDVYWFEEVIGIYVSIDDGQTWSDELEYFIASNPYQQHSVDLSAFEGMTIRVAFRHYDVSDQFTVNIDQVEAPGARYIGDVEPTAEPTAEPTEEPTEEPTVEPTVEPTDEPSAQPTQMPNPVPPTGAVALSGLGVCAIVCGIGAMLFKKNK